MQNSEILVLNSGFIPLRIANIHEAIGLLVTNKAYSVIEEEKSIKSPSIIIKIPSVIALLTYGEFPKRRVAFSKLNVIYRDDLTCQYCGKQHSIRDLTVDHIIPRSRWTKNETPTNWLNLVACCKHCNNLKKNHLLSELKWKLIRKPFEPEYMPHLVITRKKAEDRKWLDFCKVNVRLIN